MSDRFVSAEVARFVFTRDERACRAPYLGGTSMACFGKLGLEHVRAQPRWGKRAPSCPCALVALCEGHREPGMRAGRVWCTSREARAACRDYLADFGYGEHVEGHVGLILAGVTV